VLVMTLEAACCSEPVRVLAAAGTPASPQELAKVLHNLGYTKGEARALAYGGFVALRSFRRRRHAAAEAKAGHSVA
jgi:hypothetical protein